MYVVTMLYLPIEYELIRVVTVIVDAENSKEAEELATQAQDTYPDKIASAPVVPSICIELEG